MLLNNDLKVYLTIEFKTPFIKFLDVSEPKMSASFTDSFTTTPTGVSISQFISDMAVLKIDKSVLGIRSKLLSIVCFFILESISFIFVKSFW